jgi:hypothetical protein
MADRPRTESERLGMAIALGVAIGAGIGAAWNRGEKGDA